MFNNSFTRRQGVTFIIYLALLLVMAYGIKQTIFTSQNSVNSNNTMLAKQQIEPMIDLPTTKTKQTLVLAGGCFWGVEAVFEKLKGVDRVISGYAGGEADTAKYELVSNGNTKHAEAVEITYNPEQISFGQLLKVFFAVAHNPTEVNRQGPDEGSQYRSAIFFTNSDQQRVAQAYVNQITQAKVFQQPIATQITNLSKFYPAEEYHQNFIVRNPNYPYVLIHDIPKLNQLRQQFPELVQG
jgi:peptide-methionine (S)-S-oxide reductase